MTPQRPATVQLQRDEGVTFVRIPPDEAIGTLLGFHAWYYDRDRRAHIHGRIVDEERSKTGGFLRKVVLYNDFQEHVRRPFDKITIYGW